MSTGRHRLASPTAATTRKVVRSPLGITAIVVALVAVAAILVPVGLNALGCGETRYLRVSTTQSMAPVLREAASEFNSTSPSYGGECVYAQVDEIAPHRIMSAISGGQPGDSTIAPHVWVPESSAWVELARVSAEGAHGIETDPPSLASSPVVMTAPEDTEGLPGGDEAPWTTVLPDELDPERQVVMVDPNRGADGMAVMYAVRDHLGTGDAADTDMTDFVRDVQQDSAFGEIDLSTFYSGSDAAQERVDPLVVVPEQAVVDHNTTRPDNAPELEAYYPEEGTVGLDYPYVTTTEEPHLRSAAADLYEVVAGEAYRTRMQDLGFRDPDGSSSDALEGQSGIVADEPEVHGDLTGDALVDAVNDWNRLSMPSRALVLADTSVHMEGDLNGGPSRIEAAREAARTGLQLFPDETDMGLWMLSEELGADGRDEAADLHQLGSTDDGDVTRRQELAEVADEIEVEGGESHLYDNMLDAFNEVQDNYHEDKINSVIMLTAGVDDGSSDISHQELVETLQDRFDPERPVSFFIIAFGDGADEAELQAIASATSGSSFVTDDPDEIGDIFLSSISRRLCVPDCD
ncbi:substrate-binding and VWA domain-containing protein [Nocardiopsis coralli]|uniref:substrate-binding and VWA domain-containing protein n=1 Tax=Nocardiopsis coralli TaxID=2772213 RepID=UPI002E2C8E3D|nr:substrate-binding and VWA domain-containing protein [Nocardiopsis coralli]